jgi:hypothetical protein
MSQGTDDANPDPVSGRPGFHPLGVTVGAVGGAAAGAALGSTVGLWAVALGTLLGALAGALLGKSAAESMKPTLPVHAPDWSAEQAHWRANFATRPYVPAGADFDAYRAAYRYGFEAAAGEARAFAQAEPDLERRWSGDPAAARLPWQQARLAARDAFERRRQSGPPSSPRV